MLTPSAQTSAPDHIPDIAATTLGRRGSQNMPGVSLDASKHQNTVTNFKAGHKPQGRYVCFVYTRLPETLSCVFLAVPCGTFHGTPGHDPLGARGTDSGCHTPKRPRRLPILSGGGGRRKGVRRTH